MFLRRLQFFVVQLKIDNILTYPTHLNNKKAPLWGLFVIGGEIGMLLATLCVASDTRSQLFAVRRYRQLAHKRTSPVVNKQHFEVVYFPPALSTLCTYVSNPLTAEKNNKKPRKGACLLLAVR